MIRLSAEDDAALREILPRLRRFALSLTRDASQADDLVQACLERALSAWVGRRPHGDLRAWLFQILYRQFIDGGRRARRRKAFWDLVGHQREPVQPGPEDAFQARSDLELVARLPEEQRALLLLVSVEGLSYQEVAVTLGVPVGTVMSRLSRARQAFRSLTEGNAPQTRLRVLK